MTVGGPPGSRTEHLTWREQTLIRLLLLVARMLSDEQWVHQEIQTLSTHISVNGRRGEG